jgi:hypothetical protein
VNHAAILSIWAIVRFVYVGEREAMKLEDQVCSLDLAKRLKELGVKQESFFWWCDGVVHASDSPAVRFSESYKELGARWGAWAIDGFNDEYAEAVKEEPLSAFTIGELGEMLRPYRKRLPHFDDGDSYFYKEPPCWFFVDDEQNIVKAATEADARAKMLIHLLESKLVKP